eukprot:GHVS01069113.1.p1 GENE.GHVS01069113.1~~GHVS01069113.1.p1  ORF type:complete len:307 (+),score=21.56 GHVS01069113.1:72-992(+)
MDKTSGSYSVSGTYGKTNVRVVRVRRPPNSSATYSEITEVNVEVLLEGDIKSSYTEGDNSLIVPTDTIKNTAYIIAKQCNFDSIEQYGLALIRHFISRHAHISGVVVTLSELLWDRLGVRGTAHEHAFKSVGPEKFTAVCKGYRNGAFTVESGIEELKVMKTTQSGFENFLTDEYTTLRPTRDRIFCTSINASWMFGHPLPENQFHIINKRVRDRLLEVYAGPPYGGVYSKSVQETMYLMAQDVLTNEPIIAHVELVLPNIHHFHFELSRFDMTQDPNNQIFFPTDDPSGLIKCRVARGDRQPSKL